MNRASPSVEKLAELVGFHESYINSFGIHQIPKKDALEALLKAMGYNLTTEESISEHITTLEEKQWRSMLPATHVLKSTEVTPFIPVSLQPTDEMNTIKYSIENEKNEIITFKYALINLEQIDIYIEETLDSLTSL